MEKLCLYMDKLITKCMDLFDYVVMNSFDWIYFKIFWLCNHINFKIFNHNFTKTNGYPNFPSVKYIICKNCNLKCKVEFSSYIINNKSLCYEYIYNKNYKELDITCNEYIIKKLLE